MNHSPYVHPFRVLTSICLALSLAACSSSGTTPVQGPPSNNNPTTGTLDVIITGVPTNATPYVTVSGPNNYSAGLTKSLTLSVKPGAYNLNARELNVNGRTYQASISSNPANVTAGQKTNVTVAYGLEAGAVTQFTATPSAVDSGGGQVTLSWAGRNISAYALTLKSGAGVTGLPAGNTSATSATVILPGNKSSTAATFAFELTALPAGGGQPITRTLTVTVASVSTGSLGVNVQGLPDGTNANIEVSGPNGFQQALTGPESLADLAPGVYTVTPREVTANGLRYLPQVTGSPAQVTAGKATQSTVTYAAMPVSVSLTPNQATMGAEDSQTFTASVTGAADENVIWEATGGTIDGTGKTVTYTAPALAGTYTITATSAADPDKKASASVTVRASQAVQAWEQRLETVTQLLQVQSDADGNVYVAGESKESEQYPVCTERFPPECSYDAYIAKFKPDGTLVWRKTFGAKATHEANSSELAFDLIVEPDGESYALYGSPFAAKSTLVKLTANGQEVWSSEVAASSLDSDNAGNHYFWNRADSSIHLTRFHADGTMNAARTYTGLFGNVVQLGPDNNIYTAGFDRSTQSIRITRYNLDGARLWEAHTRDERSNVHSQAHNLAFDQQGGVYLSWSSEVNSADATEVRESFKAFVAKFSTQGQAQWNTEVPVIKVPDAINEPVFSYSSQLAVSPQGDAYVNASTFTCQPGEKCGLDYYGAFNWKLSRLTSNGKVVWTVNGTDNVNALATAPGRGLYQIIDGGYAHLGGILARWND